PEIRNASLRQARVLSARPRLCARDRPGRRRRVRARRLPRPVPAPARDEPAYATRAVLACRLRSRGDLRDLRGEAMIGDMYGDFSRMTFAPEKHFSAVLLQQGRVMLDSDLNEHTAVLLHHLRRTAGDLIGPYGGPAGAAAFAIGTV